MPTYGVHQAIQGDQDNPPPGWATLISDSGISVDRIDLFVTGWMSPTYNLESKIGTERIESGAIITDHVIAMPIKLRLIGMVSDIAMGTDSAGRCWGELERLYNEEAILKVITEWTMIDEMVIKSINSTQTNRGMEFNLELQQIVRVGVSPSSVAAGIPGNMAGDRQGNIDGGSKALTPAPATLTGDGLNVGTASDPNDLTFKVDSQGRVLDPESGDPILAPDGTYFTINPPAE